MDTTPQKSRILVVDDEPGIRQMLEEFLDMSGFECDAAENGEHAIASAAQGAFDLIIMDVRMPGMGGIEALREIKARHPYQAVLMVTGVSEVDTAVEAMRLGATDYMRKPFILQEVLRKVNGAIEKSRAEHADRARIEAERHELEERTREVDALKNLFRTHLDERADSIDRWHSLTEEVNRLLGQAQALKDQVDDMNDLPDGPPPTKGKVIPIRRGQGAIG
jgi:DNA-binding response OmpR family regulator